MRGVWGGGECLLFKVVGNRFDHVGCGDDAFGFRGSKEGIEEDGKIVLYLDNGGGIGGAVAKIGCRPDGGELGRGGLVAVEAELVRTEQKIEAVRAREFIDRIHAKEEASAVGVGRKACKISGGRGIGPHEVGDGAFNGDFLESNGGGEGGQGQRREGENGSVRASYCFKSVKSSVKVCKECFHIAWNNIGRTWTLKGSEIE